MIFNVDDVPIYFPYDYIYPEQLKYITEIKRTLDAKGHCLIEMPSGTGKTISLLSATVSYSIWSKNNNKKFKIAYCSRTVSEIDKTVKELKNLYNYVSKYIEFNFIGLGLSARKHLCINETVLKSHNIDLSCTKLVNRFENLKCDFYENLGELRMPCGVYDFEELRTMGIANTVCPYYSVRRLLPHCDVIIYTYNYLIDPHIYSVVSKELGSEVVVVFDEAHNIDSHCIEALTLEIRRKDLENASAAIMKLEQALKQKKSELKKVAEKEYKKLKDEKLSFLADDAIPYFYSGIERNYEFVPGNIRNSTHFISVLKRLVEFLKTKLKTTHLTAEGPASFCKSIFELCLIDKRTLKFCSQRLSNLTHTLNIEDETFRSLKTCADFGTMASMYVKGFSIIFEPFDTQAQTVFNPVLRLACLDSSIAMSHIFSTFRNVIITSGTLSPIDMYPKILNFVPCKIVEIGATLNRNSINPLIISKGNDQMCLRSLKDNEPTDFSSLGNALTTTFNLRSEPSVVRNYGLLLIELSKTVPDGIVCFFPSYLYMEEIVSLWAETNIVTDILKNKLVFIETPDYRETEIALKNYKLSCDNGRGAILLSVARGKVSEGVDFENGYGRCVVIIGVPFQYTESVRLKKRLEYMRQEYGIKEYDFLVFDAMRHAAQCLGRVLRNKNDYGLMVLADQRYERSDKKTKLPRWIQGFMEAGNSNLSVDMAVAISKRFYREMAQECVELGHSLLNEEEVKRFKEGKQ